MPLLDLFIIGQGTPHPWDLKALLTSSGTQQGTSTTLLKLPSPLISNRLSLGKLFPCFFYVSWVILSLLCKMSQKNQNKESKKQRTETGKPSATNKEQNRNCSWSPKHLLPSAGAEWEKKKLQFTHKEHI